MSQLHSFADATQVNFPDKGFDMDILLLDSNSEARSLWRLKETMGPGVSDRTQCLPPSCKTRPWAASISVKREHGKRDKLQESVQWFSE